VTCRKSLGAIANVDILEFAVAFRFTDGTFWHVKSTHREVLAAVTAQFLELFERTEVETVSVSETTPVEVQSRVK
jgi:hypothetical protein